MGKRKIFILHKLPVPYHDDLFRLLHQHPDVCLQVYHLWRGSDRRPWKAPLGTGYPNYYMNTRFGIDLRTLLDAIREKNALFVIGDWAHSPSIALILTRAFLQYPVALWIDTPQEQLRRKFLKKILRQIFLKYILLPSADAILASGKPARRVLMSYYSVPSSKIIDYQFTVDLEWPNKARQEESIRRKAEGFRGMVGCREEGVVFLVCGTIDLAKKAQDIALLSFARAISMGTQQKVGLLVAGSAPKEKKQEEDYLKHLAEELQISKHVAFLGWLEPKDMASIYLAADVLLHPANYDPFPLVVIEAMAWSMPVIGTITSGSVEEKVRDGINGYTVRPGDVDEMASCIRKITEGDRLSKMKREARKTAEEWPMSRSVSIFIELHDKLVRPTP